MTPYLLSILQGAALTVAVSLLALLVALALGLLGALAKLSRHTGARLLATAYTTLIRGVPELVLMLLVFYGGTIGLNRLLEALGSESSVDINPFLAGVLTIGFIYGAYMTETLRGAIRRFRPGNSRPRGPSACAPARPSGASSRRRCCVTRCPASPTTGWY